MAQMMMMQGQRPRGPWMVVEQLREKYDVKTVETETEQISDIDILLVVHPLLPLMQLFLCYV